MNEKQDEEKTTSINGENKVPTKPSRRKSIPNAVRIILIHSFIHSL